MHPDIRIPAAPLYSTGQLSRILGLSRSTTKMWIDQGIIRGYRMPGRRPDRRVMHGSLKNFIKTHPQFKFALDRLLDYDPAQDFPEGVEPAPPPTLTTPSAPPRSPERPRSVRRGKIPQAQRYSLKEVGFLLGLHRRTVWSKVKSGILPAFRAPATGPAPFRWLVVHEALVAFIKRHPEFRYALDRLQGYDSSHYFPTPAPTVRPRKEPLIPPGAPGWKGRPHQTRRGGFKRGPKLPDGRQPSLTAADIAGMAKTNDHAATDSPTGEVINAARDGGNAPRASVGRERKRSPTFFSDG
jgi:excisionase family DNA binding protein